MNAPLNPALDAPLSPRLTFDPDAPLHHRTIWISDIHLGTAGCKAEFLLDFLRHHESDTLYLVGDIIDGWQLKKGWTWSQSHNDVVQTILRKARKGTRVVYVPGNHDEFARAYVEYAFGGIEVVYEATHVTADGKRLLVTHGDLFDGIIEHAKWLAHLGDSLYTMILALNHWLNRLRARFGFPYWSLSQYLKHKVKNAVSFIGAFEEALVSEARRRGYDGVVCRFGAPLSLTYRFLRWFHGSSQAILVPTWVVERALESYGFAAERVVLWSRGVDLDVFKPGPPMQNDARPPVFLCVGRVAVEKNIEAFLDLDLPGTKWVAGEGPLLASLRKKHPDVRFTGVLNQEQLAELYNAANVFVFPSKTDTFGLVLLEAMACGCPVAAYPVTGPIDVIGDSPAGVLKDDLRAAALEALHIDRAVARRHAERYSWEACSRQFLAHLHPIEVDGEAPRAAAIAGGR